ncbi:MAG TPA: hypothetical protein VEV16_12755 [Daejeonella sp.]|nr:hypothetical protein [Daejeonella sp.]
MVTVKYHVLPFLYRQTVWFSSAKPGILNCFNTYYKHCQYKKDVFGYKRRPFFTKLIDLSREQSQILQGFDKNTIYEVKRADKDGVQTCTESKVEAFISFYNSFAQTKNLPLLTSRIKNYRSNLIITKAVYEGKDVVMHSYVLDEQLKRVRLVHSASVFRNEADASKRAVIGRANRFLHYQDILYFKEKGYHFYDLGGYAYQTQNQELEHINRFKDGFGGELKEESEYMPFLMVLFLKFRIR